MTQKILAFAAATMMAAAAHAQLVTPDAAWCDVMEQAFAGQGVQAKVRCDMQGRDRVLRVTAAGRTSSYRVPSSTLLPDFSTPVYIVVDEPDYRTAYRGDYRPDFRGDARSWMGPHSSLYMPQDIFTLSSDIDLLNSSLRTAVNGVSRVQFVDGQYASHAVADGVPLYVLRTTVVALQRGESYAKTQGSAPAAEQKPHQQGDRNHNNGNAYRQQDNRKVERRFAYGKLHVELTDCRSGAIVWAADLQKDDNSSSTWSNPMEDVVNNLCSQVRSQLQRLYPATAPREAVYGEVLRVCEEKKNKVESLYVGLGNDQRLRKGDVLTVYAVNHVGGHAGRQQIGTVSVTEVQGPSLCICKVKKGDKDIFNALHAGVSLVVEGALD